MKSVIKMSDISKRTFNIHSNILFTIMLHDILYTSKLMLMSRIHTTKYIQFQQQPSAELKYSHN